MFRQSVVWRTVSSSTALCTVFAAGGVRRVKGLCVCVGGVGVTGGGGATD